MMKKRAVFLDRDGTINKDVGFPGSFELIDIYSYSFEAVKKINTAGLLAVIVTNQSGVGRGFIDIENLHDIHQKLKEVFARYDAYFDGIYFCPHYISSSLSEYNKNCQCRKPFPGMAYQAASDLDIDLEHSYMVGDKLEDVLFGLNIKAQPILVLTGFGKKTLLQLKKKGVKPAHVASTLIDAVNWILIKEKTGSKGG
jgi:D-glycero-D-manno-heptose 1,7-bisphosphate phosphatase